MKEVRIRMLQKNVYADSLSCILCRDSQYEVLPEPFRMQREVIFRIPYSEYVRYLLSLTNDSNITLMHNVEELVKMALTEQPILYNFFLKDISFAIMKEIVFSERYNKKCSILLPVTEGSDRDVNMSKLLEAFPACNLAQAALTKCVRDSGFILESSISLQNGDMYKLAVVLYHLASLDKPVSEMTLIYDLSL